MKLLKTEKSYVNLAFKILRVIVPLGLLTIIFLRIDLRSLLNAFKNVDLKYLFISVIFANIFQVIGGAARWYYLVSKDDRTERISKFMTIYWVAMFYGYFVPANVGMDVYRVAAIAKKQKNYIRHIVTLIGEKLYTLLFSLLVLLFSYMAVYREIKSGEVANALNVIIAVFFSIALLSIILFLVLKRQRSVFMTYLKNKLYHRLSIISSKISSKLPFNFTSFRNELPRIIGRGFISKSLVYTVLLKLSLAVGGFFLFLSLGIKLPFWDLLFANSVFFVLFLLPISFGSLGVREGAYIIIYGLFGIVPETALAASILALGGLLFTMSIGGIISLTENLKKIKIDYGK